jgi:hypothetical protein
MLFQSKTATKLIGSLPLCGNSHVLKALIKVAGTSVIDFMLESVGTPRS